MEINLLKSLKWILVLLLGMVLGYLVFFLTLDYFNIFIWIKSQPTSMATNLLHFERTALEKLIENGNILSSAELLNNFTAYYHTLITILISLLIVLTGFITVKSIQNKKEHDELLKIRLNELTIEFDNKIPVSPDNHINKYEGLQEYLKERVTHIVENSDIVQNYKEDILEKNRDLLEAIFAEYIDDKTIEEIARRISKIEDTNKSNSDDKKAG